TIFSRDWSSDVCSSDLYANGTGSNRTATVDLGAIEEGFYAIGDEVLRVVPSRRDPSRKFAEKLDTETGRFRYEKGAIFRVAEKRSEEHTSELQSRENLV